MVLVACANTKTVRWKKELHLPHFIAKSINSAVPSGVSIFTGPTPSANHAEFAADRMPVRRHDVSLTTSH